MLFSPFFHLFLLPLGVILLISNRGLSVNTQVIETGQDLEAAVGQALTDWHTPSFRIERAEGSNWDFVAEVNVDGKIHRFDVACKLRPSVKDVEKLAERAVSGTAPLLATVQATRSLVQHCKRLGVNCLDLNGRIWLRAKGVLVDRETSRGPVQYRTGEAPVNPFSLKGSRLARVLLSFPERQWRQTELAEFTGLSQGLLSRLLKQATAEGWVAGSRGDWSVTDADGLLDAWKEADTWKKRGNLRQYSALEGDLSKLAKRVLQCATGEVAFTQWFAAGRRFPYADVPIVSAYVAETPGVRLAAELGAREVSSGGKLWLITPKDAGVFQAIRRVDGIPIACDVQIYLDLLQVGFRGPDQAEALRSWEGFRKP
ncbi:MAG: hypothetical protein E4H02_11930 [Lentisphaerales bacterium]|nr:MAG: hypothetical protein E4H02_11930 [Lentisphaerales bacterium]